VDNKNDGQQPQHPRQTLPIGILSMCGNDMHITRYTIILSQAQPPDAEPSGRAQEASNPRRNRQA
jgi:hypothetical protein